MAQSANSLRNGSSVHKFKVGDKIRQGYSKTTATVLATFERTGGADMVWSAIRPGYTPAAWLGNSIDWELVPPPKFEVGKRYRRIGVDANVSGMVLKIHGVEGDWAVGFYTNGNPASVAHSALVEGRFEEVTC